MDCKFIFVTGGVVSSLGKGITAASLGRLLKSRGLKVVNQKLDPYINVDPGTMSPYQHGEVFVTEDGAETDLDLGHYERFVNENLSKVHSVTAGGIYQSVLEKERHGDYLGGTVQVIPHITGRIKQCVLAAAATQPDIVITEIGGTVGDIESLPFLEAVRQLKRDLGRDNCLYIHVTLVPFIAATGEAKTKPTQHSVKEMRAIGIQPDIIVCRADRPLAEDTRDKISLFCNVDREAVIFNCDAQTLYEVPLLLHEQGLDELVCRYLKLESKQADLQAWRQMVAVHKKSKQHVVVGIVGKYVQLHDAYLSVAEALQHGGIANELQVDIRWINAEDIRPDNVASQLAGLHGIVVPGGFGERGLEGKIEAIRWAREHDLPFLGICLGMQMAVVEFARNVMGLKDAHSTEIDPNTGSPVIDIMPDQKDVNDKGGTMRLGAYSCRLAKDSRSYACYGEEQISERHRHRYEFNNQYREAMSRAGLLIAGVNPDRDLVEIVELPQNLWHVGCQFHPEFKSRPNHAHPLFAGFIKAVGEFSKG